MTARSARSVRFHAGIAAAALAFAGPAYPGSLDPIYGRMAKGCTYDTAAQLRLIRAYVDDDANPPRLARPRGGRRLAPHFGQATLDTPGEYYRLTIPLSGATLYGIRASRLTIQRGVASDILNVAVRFETRPAQLRRQLARAGVGLTAHDHGWGAIRPHLEPSDDGRSVELICDLSM